MAQINKTERRALLASKYIDMETPVHDVADMATIADLMVERFRNEMQSALRQGWSASVLEEHLTRYFNPAAFAVGHVLSMARQLQSNYLEPDAD